MSEHKTSLSPEYIEQQRQRLLTLRQQLLHGEERTAAAERSLQQERGDEAQEFEDRAQEMVQKEVDQARHDVDRRHLGHVERALQKIAEGSYGRSDLSGKPIPKGRLDAAPEALHTVEEERRSERD